MWLKRVMMMRVHLPSCGSLISLTPGHCDPHAAPPHTHTHNLGPQGGSLSRVFRHVDSRAMEREASCHTKVR